MIAARNLGRSSPCPEARDLGDAAVGIQDEQVRAAAALLAIAADGHPISKDMPLAVADVAAPFQPHPRHEAVNRGEVCLQVGVTDDATEFVVETDFRRADLA